MEEAAAVRRAASESVADVAPEELRRTIDEYVADGSVVPGVLTLLSARAVTDEHPKDLVEQAAGVQLIYEGLDLTRQLAHDEPWADTDEDDIDADLDVLAADVLVSRGFYLLARTPAAERAVEVVRTFGRDQTRREGATDPDTDRNLEADVFELAVVTGVHAVDGAACNELLTYADELARGYEGELPAAGDLLGGGTQARLAGFSDGPVGSPPRSAGTDP